METADIPHLLLLLISLLVLFVLSMFFSSAETAFLSLNKLKLRFLCERKQSAALRAEKILQNKQRFLSTILIGNSIVNTAISVVLTATALQLFGDAGLGIAVASGTILLLIFGEILPKSIALVYPDVLSLFFARAILITMTVVSPVVTLFSACTTLLLRLCGVHTVDNTAAVTESDLREFFKAREEGGFIDSDEHRVLTNILRYGDVSVRSVMTPRRDIIAIHINASGKEIIELSKKSHFSRFPVYSTNIDSIQGFFYIKDCLFSPEYFKRSESFTVSAYLRKPLFVLETSKLAQVEKQFHAEKQAMAIVLDEYGGTAGLITVEDVSEQIFGSLFDEYDKKESTVSGVDSSDEQKGLLPSEQKDEAEQLLDEKAVAVPLIQTPKQEIVHAAQTAYAATETKGIVPFFIAGSTRLSDLNEQFALNLVSHYSDTIGGYMMEKAGEIPHIGYAIDIAPYLFTVTEVESNRVTQIEVRMQYI